ncbi:MAG: zf-HC2 domain-containing protein [Candidatus Gastranaerophilales bacterium]|nr:zf-HC2 domain-containing protein [Candidatus Gastranaerophilales bacterium]
MSNNEMNDHFSENFLTDSPCCAEVKPLLSPYLDGELPCLDMEIMEKHLANCPECSKEFENLYNLSLHVKTSLLNRVKNNPANNKFGGLLPEEIQKCLKIRSNISAFIDGELDQTSTKEVLEHVIACKSCRKLYDNLKATSELTKNCLKKSVINEMQAVRLHKSVIKRLMNEKSHVKYIYSAAAMVFIAVLSWFSVPYFAPDEPKYTHVDNAKLTKQTKPMYVPSHGFIMSELYLETPEEIKVNLPKTAYTPYPSYTPLRYGMQIPTISDIDYSYQ